jgi:hypothetical protein
VEGVRSVPHATFELCGVLSIPEGLDLGPRGFVLEDGREKTIRAGRSEKRALGRDGASR